MSRSNREWRNVVGWICKIWAREENSGGERRKGEIGRSLEKALRMLIGEETLLYLHRPSRAQPTSPPLIYPSRRPRGPPLPLSVFSTLEMSVRSLLIRNCFELGLCGFCLERFANEMAVVCYHLVFLLCFQSDASSRDYYMRRGWLKYLSSGLRLRAFYLREWSRIFVWTGS